ncbi:MAG: bifunctional hydroxymethylpyrimidine kinase/phosphomethylpyrimidine kinase [Firmicutes bacterium]|nr:bifunctional hydroxymethylpyrimidine kinase/phosphomethylpyrimidine kinase [Bacillota bacterium]
MKTVAAINDICGFGKCSLVADISVLGAMGIQVCPLPTGVYTAQTVYPQHKNKSNTDMIDAFTENWAEMGATFDGIITGFLLEPVQARKVQHFVKVFHKPGTLLLVDPVMGDEGVTYANYSEELHGIIAELAAEADIITPNLGELFLLAGETIERAELAQDEEMVEHAVRLAKTLLNKPGKIVAVTGIRLQDAEGELLGNLLVTQEQTKLYAIRPCGGYFSGTGDLFAAALLGGILQGKEPFDAMKRAADFLREAARSATERGADPRAGSDFEQHLHMLAE